MKLQPRGGLVFAPVTGSASGVLLQGQIPDFFDIWACNRIGIRRTVVGANELLFEILPAGRRLGSDFGL